MLISKISLLLFLLLALVAGREELSTYIIHVQPQENHLLDTTAFHLSFLPDNGRLLHSYHHVASGFAARLTRQELEVISAMPGFVAAVPDVVYRVQTTHTPLFLGLDTAQGGRNLSVGSGQGIIIGLLDTGIFPDHPSFNGYGMLPPPIKWKGRCDFNGTACNGHKLIGARSFISGGKSSTPGTALVPPTDEEGHGTHTSSTAAGAVVAGAQMLGQGSGTASGIAPDAHLAMYKVCNEDGCAGADILAGIDAAVSDGCDVISMSLGGPTLPPYKDSIAIGTFAAVEKGIFVSMSAGNSGPLHGTLSNDAPWMLTVAASTMDRLISAKVILGDGHSFDGESLYQPNTSAAAPLVYAGASSTHFAQFCGNGSLDGFDIKGKIVLCDDGNGVWGVDKGAEVLRAGGVGMILTNQFVDGYSTVADPHVLPASQVSYAAGVAIKAYINSTANPTAQISFRGTVLGTTPAPAITSFSSRGPSIQNPGIVKPDITGPGVNLLAAWPFQVGPPRFGLGPTFNIISGTSMSAPHLSGIAALIKRNHPDWSPAAIKSAIMTTAEFTDRSGTPILDEQHKAADLFAIGSGHVNPEKAMDPGLVFDISPDDYVGYLCGMYTNKEVSVIVRRTVNCSAVRVISANHLNYPSVTVLFPPDWSSTPAQNIGRTVKNVGEVPALYYPYVDMPADSGVIVGIFPDKLLFNDLNEVQTFDIGVEAKNSSATPVQGAIRWVSDRHTVRIPISATFAAH
ncbi:unnamed protein product [Alopecurus aequalis]